MNFDFTGIEEFGLFREGQLDDQTPISVQIGDRSFTVTYFDLGDRITRQPVHYVFRATGSVTDANTPPDTIIDSTPANFKFVVVDNVAKFVEGRGDDQPIKELDRP